MIPTPKFRIPWARTLAACLAAVVSAVWLTTVAASPATAAVTPLTSNVPAQLISSTGNLYWTNNGNPVNGVAVSRVFRMSKSGGAATAIYQESHNGSRFLGSLAYATVDTTFYGFFVVNDAAARTSVIKRVPLAGGAARTVVTSPRYISSRDLVAYGSQLFWADEGGVRSSGLNPGAVASTRFSGSLVNSVGVDATRVYFSSGTEIRRVPKFAGQASNVAATGTSTVTSLHVVPATGGVPTVLAWTEQNGSVRGRFVDSFGTVYQQPSTTGRKASSVAVSGQLIAWTDCANAAGDTSGCRARVRNGNVMVSVPAGFFASDVQLDSSAMFWRNTVGLHKFTQ